MGNTRNTFTNQCRQVSGLELGDGTTKIFLNANSDADDVSSKLRAFLDYVSGKEVDDDFVRRVDEKVRTVRMN